MESIDEIDGVELSIGYNLKTSYSKRHLSEATTKPTLILSHNMH